MAISACCQAILDVLLERETHAAFVSEIQASVGAVDLEDSLRRLSDAQALLVLSEPAPDPHLEHFDLRVAALISNSDRASALEAARKVWDGWVRQFLANHRCQ